MSVPSAPPRAPRTRRAASRQRPTRPSTRPTARKRSPRRRRARSTAACESSASPCGRWDGTRLALARDAPDPRPGAGQALVRVHLAGICRTDLEITRGYLGFRGTPGHEWVGHVLAADDPALVGRRVVGEINLGCGICRSCRAALGRHCPGRRVLGILGADGAFAELIAVPAANLHPVPETIADREAVFTEPLAAAFEILDQMPSLAGAHAVVVGDGKLVFSWRRSWRGPAPRWSSPAGTRRSSPGRGRSASGPGRRRPAPTWSSTRAARPTAWPWRSPSSGRAAPSS